jgi:putative proteasome-type protease
MTFCLAMKVKEGIVGIADTRITSGSEVITGRKVKVFQQQGYPMFLMTSGLRSVRDKALAYFEEALSANPRPFDRLFKAVNAFTEQMRRVAREDKGALEESNLLFNVYGLVGGQLSDDLEPKLYLVYPQGNWVEVGEGTPYQIIGATGYGKPVLDRTLKYRDSMRFALKVGCLAFDSTRLSAADVGLPIDVVLYARDSFKVVEHRYEKADLQIVSAWWQERLRQSVTELPAEWIEAAFAKLDGTAPPPTQPREEPDR